MNRKQLWRRLTGFLTGAIGILLILWIAFSAWMISQQRVPQVFGYGVLRVVSGSMEPEIPVGSCLWVKKTEPASLKAGDTIAFYSKEEAAAGMPVTHRIVRVEQREGSLRFITRGIANNMDDPEPVEEEQLIGAVTGRALPFEWAGKLVSHPAVFLLVLVIPLLGLMMWELHDVVKAGKKDGE